MKNYLLSIRIFLIAIFLFDCIPQSFSQAIGLISISNTASPKSVVLYADTSWVASLIDSTNIALGSVAIANLSPDVIGNINNRWALGGNFTSGEFLGSMNEGTILLGEGSPALKIMNKGNIAIGDIINNTASSASENNIMLGSSIAVGSNSSNNILNTTSGLTIGVGNTLNFIQGNGSFDNNTNCIISGGNNRSEFSNNMASVITGSDNIHVLNNNNSFVSGMGNEAVSNNNRVTILGNISNDITDNTNTTLMGSNFRSVSGCSNVTVIGNMNENVSNCSFSEIIGNNNSYSSITNRFIVGNFNNEAFCVNKVNGEIRFSGSYGQNGYVLQSSGPNAPPAWGSLSNIQYEKVFVVEDVGETTFSLVGLVSNVAIPPKMPYYVYRNGIKLQYVEGSPSVTQFTFGSNTVVTSANTIGDVITLTYIK